MNDIEKQDIRKAIERYEYYRNSLDRMSCACVKVRNLKVRKRKPITADVTLCFGKGRREERYPNLEYTLHPVSAGTPNCI